MGAKMKYTELKVGTDGEKFYDVTGDIKSSLDQILADCGASSGVLHLFITHTSCALTISEAYDPKAAIDIENFLKHTAPRNLSFIEHDDEGPDDSPSHMKSILLNQSISLIVDERKLVLGTWQGIYLAEFRDHPHTRKVLMKFQADI